MGVLHVHAANSSYPAFFDVQILKGHLYAAAPCRFHNSTSGGAASKTLMEPNKANSSEKCRGSSRGYLTRGSDSRKRRGSREVELQLTR